MNLHRIYFSPTGGTEKVVKLLSEAWDCAVHDLDFSVYGGDYTSYYFAQDDLCLIGVPSFGGRVPAVALEHLRQMKGLDTPAVLVVAYGNRDYDDTLLELKNLVQQNGFRIIAAIAAVTEHSIMHQFGAGRPDAADVAELRAAAQQIKAALEAGAPLTGVTVKGNTPYKEYSGIPLKPTADKHCTKCGLCAKSCPVGAIPAENPAETQKESCISCMRCISVCPQQARKLNKAILFAAGKGMQKACSARKTNDFFLGAL